MDDLAVNEREQVTLPNEVLLNIARACIEPFTLRVHQQIYTPETMQSIQNGYKIVQHSLRSTDPHYRFSKSCLDATTLIVKGLTTRRDLEYLNGLPKVMNLKLVNRMFHNEIKSTLVRVFNGTLKIQGVKDFFEGSKKSKWRPHPPSPSISCIDRLYPLVREILFSDGGNLPDRDLMARLQAGMIPNLRKIVFYAGSRTVPGQSSELILGGQYDKRIKCIASQARIIYLTSRGSKRNLLQVNNLELFVTVDLATTETNQNLIPTENKSRDDCVVVY